MSIPERAAPGATGPGLLGLGRSFGWACLALFLPASVFAGDGARAPEALLAHDSVAYFRFDGLEPHRKAYDQTVLAEVMRGDLGDFGAEMVRLVRESVGFGVVKERLLAGLPPEKMVKVHRAARQLPRLLEYLQHHGFVLGVELPAVLPPRVQVTVVFPQAGQPRQREAVFAGLQLFAELSQLTVRESKHGGRVLYLASPAPSVEPKKRAKEAGKPDGPPVAQVAQLAWWQEGEHVVFTFGTEKPDDVVRRLEDARRGNLTSSPLFRSVVGFDRYETIARGFVDLEACLGKAQGLGPLAGLIGNALGLDALKSLTLHVGFAGRYQQTSLVLSLKGKRRGIMKLIPSAEASLDRLPPLPPDATSVTAVSINARAWADFTVRMQRAIGLFSFTGTGKAQNPFAEIDNALGIDVRKDLLDALGSTAVLYSSPGEGFSFLSTSVAVQVKDARKLKATLETMAQTLAADGTSVKKSRYRGVDVYTYRLGRGGFTGGLPLAPTWTVHDGWLVVGLNPPAVQGHILRSSKRFTAWQPPPLAREFLSDLKKNSRAKIIGFCVADLRASLKQSVVFGQIIVSVLNTIQEGTLDPSLVPHFQSLTEPLAPNVMALVDEGDALRLEMKGSLPLPTDVLGTDSILLLALIGGLIVG
jgi:hypothetical protein